MPNEPATKYGKIRRRWVFRLLDWFFLLLDPVERFLTVCIILGLNLIFLTTILNALKWWSIPVYVGLLGWLVFCLRITPRQERNSR